MKKYIMPSVIIIASVAAVCLCALRRGRTRPESTCLGETTHGSGDGDATNDK